MKGQGLQLVCVLLGLALPLYIANLPLIYGLASLVALAVFLFFWPQFRHGFWFLLGVISSCLHLSFLLDKQLPQEFEGQDVTAHVEIVSMPERNERNTRFEANISGLDADSFSWQGKVRLSWYYAPELKVGESWQLRLRLKRPRGFANGRGFDYQAWLLSQKIFATGYVRATDDNHILTTARSMSAGPRFEKLREHLSATLFNSRDYQQSRFMRALLLGDKSGLAQDDWLLLQNTGTLHLMAISGLHIGLIAGFGFLVGRMLAVVFALACGTRLFLHYIAPTVSLVFAFVYAGLAGFSIPTQRAFIFIVLVNVAVLLGRRLNYFNLLALCAIVVVLIDPFAFLAAGFYLSFCAVAVLFWCFMGRVNLNKTSLNKKPGQGIVTFVSAQWVLFVGLLVPLSVLTLPTSVSGLLANSIAIPLVGMLLVPLLFLAALLSFVSDQLVLILLTISDFLLTQLWHLLSYLGEFKFGSFRLFLVEPIAAIALACVALIVLSPRALTLRYLCFPLLMIAFLSSAEKKSELEVTVLDVGQGLSVFVKWPQGSLLYDTGARFSDDFDMGSRVIAPWLRASGQRSLDYLVVSHGDNDHAGGMQGLLSSFSAKNIILGPSVKFVNQDKTSSPCERSEIHKDVNMSIKVLWPKAGTNDSENSRIESNHIESNNSSCVLLLEYAGRKILLTGDIEKEVERALLNEDILPPDIDLLVVPHHGSRTSSTLAFVQHLKPDAVVFSAGYMNRYHHPNSQVQQRYEQAGSQILRTDLDGAVSYVLTADGENTYSAQINSVRKNQKRSWFW